MDKSELSRGALEEIEKKIMQDFPRFMNLDLANCIGSFLKLNYIPRDILTELNQQQTLSTFNKYSCLIVLENLVHLKYDEQLDLYDKLFAQLQKNSHNMVTKLVSRAIAIIPKLKEVYKNDKERTDGVSEYAQFFIERFNESIKVSEKQVETDIVLLSLENVKTIADL